MNKVIDYYKQCPGSGKELILSFVTFFEEQKMVSGHLRAFTNPFSNFIFCHYYCTIIKSFDIFTSSNQYAGGPYFF